MTVVNVRCAAHFRPQSRAAPLPRRATCRHSRLRRLRGLLSETEHTELLLADLVARVDRLRLAEIRDRLGAAVQCFIGEAAAVVGLDIGRIELDRLREICNRVVAVALCDVRDVSKAVLFVDRRVFASMRSIVASRDRPSWGSNSEERGEAASPLAKPKPLFALPTQSGKHVQPPPA